MACPDCEERRKRLRDAIMRGKLAEARDITVEGLRVMIGIDSAADHRRDAVAEVLPTNTPKADPAPTKTGKGK